MQSDLVARLRRLSILNTALSPHCMLSLCAALLLTLRWFVFLERVLVLAAGEDLETGDFGSQTEMTATVKWKQKREMPFYSTDSFHFNLLIDLILRVLSPKSQERK